MQRWAAIVGGGLSAAFGVYALAGAAGSAQPAQAAGSAKGARIAFARNDGVFVMNSDGSGQVRLVDSPGFAPRWSPDGGTLAVIRDFNGGEGTLWTAGGNGSGVTGPITGDDVVDFAWSPDGTRIGYVIYDADQSDIGVVNAAGTSNRYVTATAYSEQHPVWSPDGATLFFARGEAANASDPAGVGIYAVDPDSGAEKRIRSSGYPVEFSPDGTKLLFVDRRDTRSDIYVMRRDGTRVRRLTRNPPGDVYRPTWSPDGKKIAFARRAGGDRDIYVMRADGSRQDRLTRGSADDFDPRWSTDGKKILFTTDRDGDREVYVMRSDGGRQRNLTNSPATSDGWASWQPR